MKIINKYINLSEQEKSLLVEAVIFLFASKLLLTMMPFRWAIRFLKPKSHYQNHEIDTNITLLKVAIARANKLAYWKNSCLVQSFAARLMLQRRSIPSVLYLGLSYLNRKELIAHAWLIAEETFITPKGRSKFKEIFSI